MKKKIFGNTQGIKTSLLNRIENLHDYKTSPELLISYEQCSELIELSFEINRQIGLLIDRNGKTIFFALKSHS